MKDLRTKKANNMYLFIFILTILVLFVCVSNGFPYMKETHEAFNEKAAKTTINGFSLNDYLLNQLGFASGFNEQIYGYSELKNIHKKQEVFNWIGEGGQTEDMPPGGDGFFGAINLIITYKGIN